MNPDLLFINPELLQKQLIEAQQTLTQLKAKINEVPPEKILKYLLIGAVIGAGAYWLYDYNQRLKEKPSNLSKV